MRRKAFRDALSANPPRGTGNLSGADPEVGRDKDRLPQLRSGQRREKKQGREEALGQAQDRESETPVDTIEKPVAVPRNTPAGQGARDRAGELTRGGLRKAERQRRKPDARLIERRRGRQRRKPDARLSKRRRGRQRQ